MRRARRGFMLAEVLIAITILATGVSVLLMAIINATNLNRDTRDRAVAIFLAERQMWALEEETDLADERAVRGSQSGSFEPPEFSRFRWESAVRANPRTASYELRVTVYWTRSERDERERRLSLHSQSMMPRDSVQGG